jgi:LysM repeat protein
MSNPFIEPGLLLAELERRRRERLKVGVYAVLGTAAIFLTGMLIQGCKNQHTESEAPGDPVSEVATNNNSTNATPVAASNPETNTATPPTTAAAPTPPSTEPPAEAAPVPPPSAVTAPPAVTSGDAEKVYVVKRGDSLARIAHAHGTTVKALKAANALKSDVIVAGRKLKLPPAHTRPANGPAASAASN